MRRKWMEFKKVLVVFTTLLLALTPSFSFLQNESVFASEVIPLLQDDFNALETGSIPDGYVISGENGNVFVSEVPSTEDKSLFFEDNGTDTIKAVKSFHSQAETVTVAVNFMQTVLGSTTKVLRLLDDSSSNAAVHIETRSGVISYKNSDNSFTGLVDYVENTWYAIKVVADPKTGTADVYINNELKLDKAPFHRAVTTIGAFDSYTTGTSAKSHYLDDIQLYAGFYESDIPIKETHVKEPVEEQPGSGDGTPNNNGQNGVYEAENAELFNAIVDNKHQGFTGTGFVDFKPSSDGSFITLKVNVDNAGEYTLNFRYANGSTETRSLDIVVNGQTVNENLEFTSTGEWTAWKTKQVKATLSSGENVILVKTIGLNEGPNMDHIQVFQEFDSIYEAEEASLTDAIVDNQHPGYTGTGFVDYKPNAPGGTITWTIPNVPTNGEYSFDFRYANGATDNRPIEIKINDHIANNELAFPSTGEWTDWKVVSTKVTLKAGENIIVATGVGASGGANIDHLRIYNTTSDSDIIEREPVEVKEVAMEELVDGLTLKKLEIDGILSSERVVNADKVSRLEFFASINRVLGYNTNTIYQNLDLEASVFEVSKENWWSYVLEAADQAGYAKANEDGNIRPHEIITRLEAAVIIADVLNLSPGKSDSNKNETDDSNKAIGAVVSNGYMNNKDGFGKNHQLSIDEANFIINKIAAEINHEGNNVHIVAADAISHNLVAVMLNGQYEDFDVKALTIKGAMGSFKGLNPSFANMYPTRAAVGTNKFGDTVVIYELQDSLEEGKMSNEENNQFSGNLEELKVQANNLVSWQMDHGGWTKSMESKYSRLWDGQEKRSTQFGPNGEELGSIDNNATINQIRFISQVYQETKDTKLKDSVLKGIDFLLTMQTDTGGWPQVYPQRGNSPDDSVYYSNYVTFNDNAMINVLELFDDLLNENYPFNQNLLNDVYKQQLEQAMNKGIDYILKAQIKVDGNLTAWCAQHDPITYEPQHARAYEHPSISGSESVGIVKFLMSRPNQTPEIKQAVLGALQWFDQVKLDGIRYVSADPNGVYFVEDKDAVTWYRFYEIGTNKPIFSGRDGVIKHTIQEIEKERRDGYSWGGSYAKQLLEIGKTTGYFENHIYVEVAGTDVVDSYGRKLVKGDLKRVTDLTKYLQTITVKLVVSQDGSGDYVTVQEAIDAVPDHNKEPVEIFIKNGTYKEVVKVSANKPFLSLIGESAEKTILTYDNYAKKARPEGGTYGTSGSASVYLYGSDFTAKNLTMENSFDESLVEGGSQAVAVYTRGDRMKFQNVRFLGNQDTLYANGGTQYFSECYIEGDVDFIFGAARAVFDNCEIVSLDRGSSTNNGYITAASTNINDPYGFLFINSRLTSDAEDGTVYLGRPWHPGGDPNAIASVIYMNCELGAHIQPIGWTDMSGFSAEDARFYEFNNTGPGVNIERPQLTNDEAVNVTIENVLKGWNPVQ